MPRRMEALQPFYAFFIPACYIFLNSQQSRYSFFPFDVFQYIFKFSAETGQQEKKKSSNSNWNCFHGKVKRLCAEVNPLC